MVGTTPVRFVAGAIADRAQDLAATGASDAPRA
jgi:hypothetical protein